MRASRSLIPWMNFSLRSKTSYGRRKAPHAEYEHSHALAPAVVEGISPRVLQRAEQPLHVLAAQESRSCLWFPLGPAGAHIHLRHSHVCSRAQLSLQHLRANSFELSSLHHLHS